jgi:predicted O-methyltransferase YrrM
MVRIGIRRARDIVRVLREINRSKRVSDVHTLVEMAMIHFAPFQIKSELTELMMTVAGLKPNTAAEIGTRKGGTLFLLCRFSSPGANIISIDLPGGRFGGGYATHRRLLYRTFAGPGQSLHLLRRNSHDPRTLDGVKHTLAGAPLDFLFIDGDHSYEGVKQDFEMYSPLVRKGGLVAFHDVAGGPGYERWAGGVPIFWRQVRDKGRSYREVIASPEQSGCGVGLLWV